MTCVTCARDSGAADWRPRWGSLYGTVAVCSLECAAAFARQSRYGVLRPGDLDMLADDGHWYDPLTAGTAAPTIAEP